MSHSNGSILLILQVPRKEYIMTKLDGCLTQIKTHQTEEIPPPEEIFSAEKLISIGFLKTGERVKRVEEIFFESGMRSVMRFLYLYSWNSFFCLVASKIMNINKITNLSSIL
jgi:hypothetical protein